VQAAKASFYAAFAAAEMGEHAALAPHQGATAYLDDAEDVAAAKEEFMAYFAAAERGEMPIPAMPAMPALPYGLPMAYNNYAYGVNPAFYGYANQFYGQQAYGYAAPVAYAHGMNPYFYAQNYYGMPAVAAAPVAVAEPVVMAE
jgi:hypothetical protein